MRISTGREKGAGVKHYMYYSTEPDRYSQHTKLDPSFCNQSALSEIQSIKKKRYYLGKYPVSD